MFRRARAFAASSKRSRPKGQDGQLSPIPSHAVKQVVIAQWLNTLSAPVLSPFDLHTVNTASCGWLRTITNSSGATHSFFVPCGAIFLSFQVDWPGATYQGALRMQIDILAYTYPHPHAPCQAGLRLLPAVPEAGETRGRPTVNWLRCPCKENMVPHSNRHQRTSNQPRDESCTSPIPPLPGGFGPAPAAREPPIPSSFPAVPFSSPFTVEGRSAPTDP
jgi:hypothetical protein